MTRLMVHMLMTLMQWDCQLASHNGTHLDGLTSQPKYGVIQARNGQDSQKNYHCIVLST